MNVDFITRKLDLKLLHIKQNDFVGEPPKDFTLNFISKNTNSCIYIAVKALALGEDRAKDNVRMLAVNV